MSVPYRITRIGSSGTKSRDSQSGRSYEEPTGVPICSMAQVPRSGREAGNGVRVADAVPQPDPALVRRPEANATLLLHQGKLSQVHRVPLPFPRPLVRDSAVLDLDSGGVRHASFPRRGLPAPARVRRRPAADRPYDLRALEGGHDGLLAK